jgi:TonB-linked SusC/RagA family outer membrane protein
MIRRVRWKTVLLAATSATALVGAAPRGLSAQEATGTIQGTVIDAGTRRPLPGAQVFIAGTQVGAATNAQGIYRIVNVNPGQRELRVRLIGYAPAAQNVAVVAGQTATSNFNLTQSAIELSTVSVVGAAVQEERKLGNTVAVIQPPQYAPIADFSQALQGREPGVVGLPSSGTTGEGARIRIRGNASLSQSNEPIVYIDGVRADNGGGFGQGFVGTGGGGQPSRLDDLDPNSIDRVEVLKGAAAATLYGTEASNGVIQIFTKKGSAGAPTWSFMAEEAALRYPTGRIEANYGFARSDTQATRLSEFYGQQIAPFQVFSRPFATQLFETGRAATYSATVNGGTPAITYFVSGRYYNENGPFGGDNIGNYYGNGGGDFLRTADIARRYQGTVNLGVVPSRQLRFNVRALYTDSHNEVPENANSIYAPYTVALFSKPENATCRDGFAGPGQCATQGNPTGASTFGTLRELLQQSIEQDARHFNGVLSGNYTPMTALSFDGSLGIDFVSQRSDAFLPFGNNLDLRTNQANQGEKSVDERIHQEITLSGNGNWTVDITPGVNSQFLFGAQGFLTRDNNTSSTNQGFPGPGIEVVSGGSNPQLFEVFAQIVNAGFFAQEQLGFNDWIFGTVGARYDYNSAFGEAAGGVLYPKVSFSVVPTDRPNFSLPSVSLLRFRGALGQAGRQPGAFDQFTTYGPLTSELGGGLVPQNLGNPNLKPEISTEWELGTEIGFFENRAGIEFTYWDRVLNDALVARQFPVSGGFRALQLDNVGQMKSQGWELGLTGIPVNRPNLTVDVFANSAFLSQYVSSLGGAPPLKVGGSYPRYRNFILEGYAPGSLFGAQLPRPCAGGTRQAGGPLCLQAGELPFDTNRDGLPDTEEQLRGFLALPRAVGAIAPLRADDDQDGDFLDHYLGKPIPDFSGSFGGTITFLTNWRLQNLFEYKAGRYTITDLTGAFRRASPANGGNTRQRAETESTLLDPSSTPEERLAAAQTYAYELVALSPYDGLNQNFSGDFLRWRELSLTYTTPAGFANRLGANDVALTFGVRNLALWTKYPGVDPEVNVFGRSGANAAGGGTDNNFGEAIDAFGFPLPRRFSFAVRAGF